MSNEITEKEKLAFDYLRILLGVVGGDRPIMLIYRAIQYADPLEYFHEPKSKEEAIRREIFLVRARSYWNRKMLEFNSDNYKQINDIRTYEQHEVTRLRMQLQSAKFPAKLSQKKGN